VLADAPLLLEARDSRRQTPEMPLLSGNVLSLHCRALHSRREHCDREGTNRFFEAGLDEKRRDRLCLHPPAHRWQLE